MTEKTKKFDNYAVGIITGLIIPPIAIYFFYIANNFHLHFAAFINYIVEYHLASKVLSVALVANLVGFYLFLQTKRYLAVKGVIAATFLYALLAVIYIFFF
jgi:hypothetical protein